MSRVTFENATCVYPGSDLPAVDRLDLRVADGELFVLVGPEGAGKSTTLRVLAGLEDLSTGRILIGERDVSHVPPKDRDVAMVFQNYALYPHLSIADNMGFSLKFSGIDADEVRRRVQEAAEILGLADVLDERPNMVTSGQRQQVAMGRAIVRQPQVFLMDEPLLNLERGLRERTREQITRLQAQLGVTTVYATADPVEAMLLGTRVGVLNDGVLQQVGAPREVYDRPANAFVAGYVGAPAMNLVPVPVTNGHAAIGDWSYPAPNGMPEVTVGVRPEDLRVGDAGFPVLVSEMVEVDSGLYLRGRATELDWPILARTGEPLAAGTTVTVVPDPEHVHLFDPVEGRRLN